MATGDDRRILDALLSQLDGLPFRSRAMFGGYGLYLEDTFFGVITDGRLYFRTDEESREQYIARGMPALQPKHRPRGKHTVDRNFAVPDDVLADPDALREWALRAARAIR